MKIKRTLSFIIAAVLVIIPLLAASAFASADETPLITQAPGNLQWPEGSLATYKCVCENDPGHEKFIYEWHIVYEGKDYTVSGMSDPWCDYVDKSNSGTVGNAVFLSNINHGLNGAEIYCVVKNHNISVSTPQSTIFIIDEDKFTPPDITAPVYVTCMQGDVLDLRVKGSGTAGNVSLTRDYISYHWYSSPTGSVNNIIPIETDKDIYENNVYRVDTSAPGTYYYVCGVFDGVDNMNMCNRSYSNVITVEIEEKIENVDIELISAPLKTEYEAGDTLDLTGLKVRILLTNGYIDLNDGAGVYVSLQTLDTVGVQTVTVTYEGLKTEFKVNVRPKTVIAPLITKQPQGGQFTAGEECTLTVEATADSGSTLYYNWYSVSEDQLTDTEIPGAYGKDFTPPQTAGDAYYRCYVYAVDGDGNTSDGIPTDVIKVTYISAGTDTSDSSKSENDTAAESAEEGSGTDTAEPESTENAGVEAAAQSTSSGLSVAVAALIVVAVVMFLVLGAVIALIVIIIVKKKK